MRLLLPAVVCLFWGISTLCFAQQQITVNPKDIQYGNYRHKEFSESFLQRVKATTDIFESIDGISYAQAVDLYKRDVDPEANLMLWEEMAKAYKSFCKVRCTTPAEKKDVYTLLLLRTMYDDKEALKRSNLKVLKQAEAQALLKQYRLPPQPIYVTQSK